MRRSSRGNTETAASLFPFLAVLLCTMGAMVVLLVAMAHVSRQKAELQAEMQVAAAKAADSPEQQLARERLAEAKAYRDRLGDVRTEAAAQLEDEQSKLTGIEDHIRRLQDEVLLLQTEAQELFALEEEHYDDQAMAEQELERLNELTGMLTEEIKELEEEAAGRQRRYAIVPMRDEATGTHRPAVYFECQGDGIVLQPEGIRLTREDFLPPVHVSSPLAAAIRTINQYYADHPEARGVGEAGSPYPLLVVRPDGISAYQAARTVLESINDEYGYQPVAEEWPLEYESPNPILAEQVAAAIELARAERKRLAVAAPQLFQTTSSNWAWGKGRGGGGGAANQGSLQSSLLDTEGANGSDNPFANVNFSPTAGSNTPESYGEGREQGEAYGSNQDSHGTPDGLPTLSMNEERSLAASGDQLNPYAMNETSSDESSATEQAPSAGGAAGQGAGSEEEVASAANTASPPSSVASSQSPTAQNQADQGQQPASDADQRPGIPMRRSIELTVYADRIVFSSGKTVELTGPFRTLAQQVAAALKQHADSWGIAGQGFYWKPSLTLNTTPDGQALATQLTKQLRNAGIRVSQQPAANTAWQGGQDASRRR